MSEPGTRFYEFGPFRLDPEQHLLLKSGHEVRLPPKAFAILLMFVENAGRLLTKEELINRAWPDVNVVENNLPRTVSTVKRALRDGEHSEPYILTVPKVGYRFVRKVQGINDIGLASPQAGGEQQPTTPNFPNQPHLLARAREVQAISHDIADHPITTVVAPPGFGKTSLATLVAAELSSKFQDGVCFVPLESIPEPRDQRAVNRAIAAAFGESADHDTLPALIRLFAKKNLLLVLDACETVLEFCEAVASALMLSCPGVKILATSRRAIGASGEKVWNLPPLDQPEDGADWAALNRFLCVRLFARTAENSGRVLQRDPSTALCVTALCQLAEGVPLAIELAASMTPTNSLEEIIEAFRDDFRLGGSQEQKVHRRIARSHQLLSPPAKLLFRRLAVFSGGWNKRSATAVCGDTALPSSAIPRLLQGLVDSSLVSRTPPSDRYRMLEMTRAFASVHLAEDCEDEKLNRAHFDHFRDLSEKAAGTMLGRDMRAALDLVDEELGNVIKALNWSLSNCPKEGLALCAALHPYWVVTGRLTEGRERLAAFLEAAPECPERVRLLAWRSLGLLAYHQSDYEKGIDYCERSLALARTLDDRWACSLMLMAGGSMRLHQRGEHEVAFAYFAESLAIAMEIDDPWLLSLAIGNLAMHRAYMVAAGGKGVTPEELEEIMLDGSKSLALAREAGNPWMVALSLMNRATVLRFFRRDQNLAEEHIQEAFLLRCEIKEKYGMIQCLYKLAAVACERQSFEQYHRAAILLGGLDNLIGGRGKIPIPKLNQPDFEWTVNTCHRELGDKRYHRYFLLGSKLLLSDLVTFAQSRATDVSSR
jgi:predicted ATPase/DNA-binding winged helix-turn-helix (wHTH) protein